MSDGQLQLHSGDLSTSPILLHGMAPGMACIAGAGRVLQCGGCSGLQWIGGMFTLDKTLVTAAHLIKSKQAHWFPTNQNHLCQNASQHAY
jgi:hypothetical protein